MPGTREAGEVSFSSLDIGKCFLEHNLLQKLIQFLCRIATNFEQMWFLESFGPGRYGQHPVAERHQRGAPSDYHQDHHHHDFRDEYE